MIGTNSGRIIQYTVQCLQLVDEGLSERSSVDKIVHATSERQKVLRNVLEIVSQQDSIDLGLQRILSDKKRKSLAWNFLRLAYFLLSNAKMDRLSPTIQALRENAPPRTATDLEKLTGFVIGSEFDIRNRNVQSDEAEIAARTHYQVWWVTYCCRLLGRNDAVKLLSTKTRPKYLHVNPLKNEGAWDMPKAQQAFGQFLQNTSEKRVYLLQAPPSLLSSQFSAGLFQIQDLPSFLAARAGDPRPGQKILDVCAAPGTKTCTLAQFMMNRGSIVSVDTSRPRFKSWIGQISRMGVTIAEPVITDAKHLGIHDQFDLVLVDPPCSGSGVFDRNPRMKWHISPESLRQYSKLQQEILNEASRLVSGRGRLVYSTCSITTEENENIISKFLKSHPQFETRPIIPDSGSPGLGALSDARRFYPHKDGTAGYFIARLDQSDT